jgi:hypothetical protein
MVLAACGNETARAPNPTAYDWPDKFGYRITYAARTARDSEVLGRYDEWKNLRFAARDDGSFVVWHDSVRRVEARRGAPPTTEPLWPEDTLRYFVRLSRWGEFLAIEPGCDPAVAACREALPSALPRELRRLIPRLPVWWPPKGYEWRDTLALDDGARPRGLRGTVTTVYRAARDTAVGGGTYWVVTWRSAWRGARAAAGGAMVAGEPAEEHGVVWVDKRLLVPALVEWEGAMPPPSEPGSSGASRTEIRGRAMLLGSVFDSLRVPEEAR